VEGFARAQHGGRVHPHTLGVLACSGRLRRVLTDRHGAVLDLGRARRFATRTQKPALLARDGGCLIPGCVVPGDHCDVHHPRPWADGGDTDLDNLVLLCERHHSEIHDGDGWQIEMLQGIPWVRPPAWAHPMRPLLRNTAHRRARSAG
jgi:HNH endonuclease